MKPLNRKNYGSIPHLSNSKLGTGDHFIHEGQERILTIKTRDKHDEIFVFEKYDGSNVGICKKEGKIFALTRAGYEAHTSPYNQHIVFDEWVKENESHFSEILNEGERICGEWLYKSHGLRYTIKNDPIIFFDYFDKDNKRQSFYNLLGLGLPMPRLLHKGTAISVDKLIPILNRKTDNLKSMEDPEGMVYRVERKGKVDFLAKWVRNDFETGKYLKSEDVLNVFNNNKN